MLYREIIAVCSQTHTKQINTVCGRNVEMLNVKLAVHKVTNLPYRKLPVKIEMSRPYVNSLCARRHATRYADTSVVQSYPSDNLWFCLQQQTFIRNFLCMFQFVVWFIYRVIHDLWTLLQEMIFSVFVIRKVHINKCRCLCGYGVKAAWNREYRVRLVGNDWNKIIHKHIT